MCPLRPVWRIMLAPLVTNVSRRSSLWQPCTATRWLPCCALQARRTYPSCLGLVLRLSDIWVNLGMVKNSRALKSLDLDLWNLFQGTLWLQNSNLNPTASPFRPRHSFIQKCTEFHFFYWWWKSFVKLIGFRAHPSLDTLISYSWLLAPHPQCVQPFYILPFESIWHPKNGEIKWCSKQLFKHQRGNGRTFIPVPWATGQWPLQLRTGLPEASEIWRCHQRAFAARRAGYAGGVNQWRNEVMIKDAHTETHVTYLSICLSVCLSVCLPVYLSIYLSIYLYVYIHIQILTIWYDIYPYPCPHPHP